MKTIKRIRESRTLRGIITALFSLFILEFGSMAVLSGFENVGIWNKLTFPYLPLLVINAIVAGLLGVAIINKRRILLWLAYTLNLLLLVMIIAGYIYFILFRFLNSI